MFEDAVDTAVGVDQLRCRLFAHAGDAVQVVAGVAAQRCVLRIQGGGDTGSGKDARLVIQGVVADSALVVQHLDVRIADQLVAVAVTSNDDHIVAQVLATLSHRGDDVVSLPASQIDDGHVEGRQHLANQPHLLTQNIGGCLALRFVQRVRHVPERWLGAVKGD